MKINDALALTLTHWTTAIKERFDFLLIPQPFKFQSLFNCPPFLKCFHCFSGQGLPFCLMKCSATQQGSPPRHTLQGGNDSAHVALDSGAWVHEVTGIVCMYAKDAHAAVQFGLASAGVSAFACVVLQSRYKASSSPPRTHTLIFFPFGSFSG